MDSMQPQPGEGFSQHTAAGGPMGNPIPLELASGVSTENMAALTNSSAQLMSALATLADARNNAKAAIAALESGTAFLNVINEQLLPAVTKIIQSRNATVPDNPLSKIQSVFQQVAGLTPLIADLRAKFSI